MTRKQTKAKEVARPAAPVAVRRTARASEAQPSPAAPDVPARQPDFVWSGQPVYRCHQGCGDRFERINDVAEVLEHERTMHPTNTNDRPSLILGADGRPLKVSD